MAIPSYLQMQRSVRRARGLLCLFVTLIVLLLRSDDLKRPPQREGSAAFALSQHHRSALFARSRTQRTQSHAGADTGVLLTDKDKLLEAEVKLRKAEAFKLPEVDELRQEVDALRRDLGKAEAELAVASQEVHSKSEEPQSVAGEAEEATAAPTQPVAGHKAPLSERLNWEKMQAMSTDEKVALFQEVGPAFTVSIGIVAVCYWSISLPILAVAYHESTGQWPSIQDVFSLNDGGAAAGALAGVLGLAALMKPLRIAAAMALTPWTAENVLPKLPQWLVSQDQAENQKDKPNR